MNHVIRVIVKIEDDGIQLPLLKEAIKEMSCLPDAKPLEIIVLDDPAPPEIPKI